MSVLASARLWAASAAVAVFAVFATALSANAGEEVFLRDGYAANGYDAVSYFQESGPVEGVDAHTYEYEGALYRFASAENLATFAENPAAYAPAYGGFCAFGTAMGYKVPTDPHAYEVVDGTLYLNVSKKVHQRWAKDIPGYIRGADNNWPLIKGYEADALHSVSIDGLTQGPQ